MEINYLNLKNEKYLALIALFVFIACSDSSRIEIKQYKNNGKKIKDFIEKIDVNNHKIAQFDTNLFDSSILMTNNIIFVYFLDASCSACIGDYFHFVNSVKFSDLNAFTYGICNESYEELISYYVDEINHEYINERSLMLFTNETYPYKQNQRHNVLIIKSKKVIGSFVYASGNFFE